MKKILLTVLVWILPTVLWGKQLSDKQYIFQRIDVREGLSYQVNCMTVSHRTGHAWMGTKNGIGRFDGYEQKKYLNCNIDQLVEDRNNNIWALGSEGVFLYDAVNDTFYRACDLNGNLISASSICLWDDGVFSEDLTNYTNMIIRLGKSLFSVRLLPIQNSKSPIFTVLTIILCWLPTVGWELC